jgi:hypothetical protein
MGKRNKIRYQSEKKPRVLITLTGNVYLRFVDDEAIEAAVKGDMQVFPNNDALNSTRLGEYDGIGFSGYFKVDVFDGRNWQPVIINDIFTDHENHFGKGERPIDTYVICEDVLKALAGQKLLRTYREHYELDDGEPEEEPAKPAPKKGRTPKNPAVKSRLAREQAMKDLAKKQPN